MDDRDLPRKLTDGKRVKAYYSYDVTSGCVIGAAYSRSKNEELFIDCLRDMFRMIDREGLGMPMEVEVENHLVNKFFDDLANMFPFMRICNPGNSQEKHAEHSNRAKKYGVEKKNHVGIGRFYLSEAYRVDTPKLNDEYKDKTYSYETLVADDIADNRQYNNQLHPDQKRYPGKTRWQVLVDNQNPDAKPPIKSVVYKVIGERTETSIARSQYVKVQYAKYSLPTAEIMTRLEPGNYSVTARYLPDSEGIIREVYLYQGDRFICRCERIEEYNTSKAEWQKGADDVAYTEQAEYVSQFDKLIRDGKQKLAKAKIINPEVFKEADAQEVKVHKHEAPVGMSIEDLLNDYDPAATAKQARNNI